MARESLTLDDVRRQLALVGIEADAATLEAVHRRVGFARTALETLDKLDLGMSDPAPIYRPDEE